MANRFHLALLALAAGVLVLSGCAAPPTAALAMRCGDETVSAREVDQVIEVYARNPGLQIQAAAVAADFARIVLLEHHAAVTGITVDEAGVSDVVGKAPELAPIRSDPAGRAFERRAVRAQLILNQVPDRNVLRDYVVEVNPRYGIEWVPFTAEVIIKSGSLSQVPGK